MPNITKEIKIKVSMPDDLFYCQNSDGNACYALNDNGSFCNHLGVSIAIKQTFPMRDLNCPFSVSKCMICKKPLLPVEVKTNQWDLVHYCGNDKAYLPEIRITGHSSDAVITQYNGYLISIKKFFTQR